MLTLAIDDFDADDDDEEGNMDDEAKRQVSTMGGICLMVMVTLMQVRKRGMIFKGKRLNPTVTNSHRILLKVMRMMPRRRGMVFRAIQSSAIPVRHGGCKIFCSLNWTFL